MLPVVDIHGSFQSTLPVWGATGSEILFAGLDDAISIHAPRVGSDPPDWVTCCMGNHFNPRSPCGERLLIALEPLLPKLFQSTLPVWGATLLLVGRRAGCGISIHAPRVGSDTRPQSCVGGTPYFNPRSPCGERLPHVAFAGRTRHFNPRSPCGERLEDCSPRRCPHNFNPRSPCGERLGQAGGLRWTGKHFNPRSPCGERPACRLFIVCHPQEFQSTLPVWGATSRAHAHARDLSYFNPRSPCGERPGSGSRQGRRAQFQSTLPVWGATFPRFSSSSISRFQSTLPVWGATYIL